VAAFARSSFGRLFLVQLLVAMLVALATAWFLQVRWFPSVEAAIERLPLEGRITSGRLTLAGDSPELLAENRFLSFAVDLNHQAKTRSPAHLQVEFGQKDLRLYSLFGFLSISYPKEYVIAFNFPELKPWWGARAPMFLAIAVGSTIIGLMASWTALATAYVLPVWLIGLYCNRDLTFWGSWRLGGAALMPGALLMTGTIVCYGLGQLDVLRFLTAFILHILVGWAYLILGALAAPPITSGSNMKVNPFKAPAADSSTRRKGEAAKADASNPFSPKR
jgi:hypothetical protein